MEDWLPYFCLELIVCKLKFTPLLHCDIVIHRLILNRITIRSFNVPVASKFILFQMDIILNTCLLRRLIFNTNRIIINLYNQETYLKIIN